MITGGNPSSDEGRNAGICEDAAFTFGMGRGIDGFDVGGVENATISFTGLTSLAQRLVTTALVTRLGWRLVGHSQFAEPDRRKSDSDK